MMRVIAIIFISLLAVAAAAAVDEARADFYGYVDADGVVHVSNVPSSKRYAWLMKETRSRADASASGAESGSKKRYEEIVYAASMRHGVDPGLVKAIVQTESDFNSLAVSNKGARGLMQLMPDTAKDVGVRDTHDPEENVDGGVRHLKRLLDLFNSDVRLAVAAYNAGENAVIKYGAVPPYGETREYVKKVLARYDRYRASR